MTEDLKRIEQIEAFLEGRMNPEEAAAFQEKMEKEKNLAAEVAAFELVLGGLREEGRDQLKAKFKSWDEEEKLKSSDSFQPEAGKVIDFRRYIMWGAAAVIIAVSLIYFLVPGPGPEQIFADHFVPHSEKYLALVDRSGTTTDSLMQEASQAYGKQNYPLTIELLQRVSDTISDPNIPKFYIGVSFLADGRISNALKYLRPVSNTPDHALTQPAIWYRGLAYLKTEYLDSARIQFEVLAMDKGSEYQNAAREILNDLD